MAHARIITTRCVWLGGLGFVISERNVEESFRVLFVLLVFAEVILETCFGGGFSISELGEELVRDFSSLRFSAQLTTFVFAVPFDDSVRSLVPKAVVSEFFEEHDVSSFTALALLTAGIVYPLDPYASFTILESFSVTLALTALTKFLVGRARPFTDEGVLSFRPFSISSQYQSFPSAHASLSWAIFTPVAERFGFVWYALPVLFSVQRLTSDNHWLSDVIAGASLGWWLGVSFYKTRHDE